MSRFTLPADTQARLDMLAELHRRPSAVTRKRNKDDAQADPKLPKLVKADRTSADVPLSIA